MCDVVDSSLDILQVNFKFFIHKSVCVCVCACVCVRGTNDYTCGDYYRYKY